MAIGTGRRDWRRRWADRQNEQRRQAFDAAFAAWQRDDHEACRMLAAARDFHGLDSGQVAPYLALHRGETAYWLLPAVALVESSAPLTLPPPAYADFVPNPSPPGVPVMSRTIDAGVAIVTNKRTVLIGAHRREWQYAKLVGLAHLPDNRTTLMRVSNRVKISGLAMEPDAAASFRTRRGIGDHADRYGDLTVGHLPRGAGVPAGCGDIRVRAVIEPVGDGFGFTLGPKSPSCCRCSSPSSGTSARPASRWYAAATPASAR